MLSNELFKKIMRKKKSLIKAQKSGNIVKVAYKSGSQPNHAREIIPIRVANNEVLAHCLNSGTKKSFFIRKLRILTDKQYTDHIKWDPNLSPLSDYELSEIKKKELKCSVFSPSLLYS